VTNSMTCSHGRCCTRARGCAARCREGRRQLRCGDRDGPGSAHETGEDLSSCPDCGVVAVGHGRRQVQLHDIPCFGRSVRLLWANRVLRCSDPDCPRKTLTEEHLLAGPRAKLAARAVAWATDALAWQCYQKLRNIYHARPEHGRALVAEVIGSFPTCPIPEVARLGRKLKQWKAAILAYFDTQGASNGPTEAINVNGVIETTRRIARGFRNFTNYRLRCLLVAGGHRPYRIKQANHA